MPGNDPPPTPPTIHTAANPDPTIRTAANPDPTIDAVANIADADRLGEAFPNPPTETDRTRSAQSDLSPATRSGKVCPRQ